LPDIVWSLKGLDDPCGDVASSKTSLRGISTCSWYLLYYSQLF